MKTWSVQKIVEKGTVESLISSLLEQKGIQTKVEKTAFLNPKDPLKLTHKDVGLEKKACQKGIDRIITAIKNKESIVVYTDYDADGITAGAIMWEALHACGAAIMPYVPKRQEEGYGFSTKGIDAVIEEFHPTLIITVDHGISGAPYVAYAKEKGVDVVVTDHHLPPETLPDCPIIHTTHLCGAGVAWFVAKELFQTYATHAECLFSQDMLIDLLALAAIGTIADMVPLTGANRSIAKFGLMACKKTHRVGLLAILKDSGIPKDAMTSYVISHMVTPRLNALGRLEHALDALRLLCTTNEKRAEELATKLGLTNKERQKMTIESALHAKSEVSRMYGETISKKILLIAHESYNQGVIGLVAGKLVEEYYRPAIVLSKGEELSKASARSIRGFNIVEAIRSFQELLVDVGGHPLAAGFTIETKNIPLLREKLEVYAEQVISESMLFRPLFIDAQIPLSFVTEELWHALEAFEPYGLGNYEPVFATRGVFLEDVRQIGADGKHLKLRLRDATISQSNNRVLEAVAFNMGSLYASLKPDVPIDIAYTIDMNEWNGRRNLQIKIKDIQTTQQP